MDEEGIHHVYVVGQLLYIAENRPSFSFVLIVHDLYVSTILSQSAGLGNVTGTFGASIFIRPAPTDIRIPGKR